MQSDGVILLHGIFLPSLHMRRLERFLQRNGYKTLNISYPSTRLSIEEIIDYIHPSAQAFRARVPGRLHWVGYSMGALVIRAYMHKFAPEVSGRVVMLAPPNQGSEVADFFKNWRLYKKLYGHAGQQLITSFAGAEKLFGAMHYELGVIAGNRSFDPISSYIIGKPSDGKVSVESTKIEGMKEHIVIPVNHTFFPLHRLTLDYTLRFLENGRF